MAELDKKKLDEWITKEPEYAPDVEAFVMEDRCCSECDIYLTTCEYCNDPFDEGDDIMCCENGQTGPIKHYHRDCYSRLSAEEEQ